MHHQQRNDFKTIAQIAFWMSFLLLIVASTSVFALEAPETIIEGETLTVTWNQSSGTAYSLEREGAQVATQSPYEWQTQTGDAGSYIFSLYENSSFVATTTVEVIENTINFTIIEPSSETYTTNTIPVELQTHSPVDFCYYVLESESNTLDENDNIHSGEFTRQDGIYTVELKCKSGSEITSKERTLLIDSTAPELLEKKPSGTVTGDKATISVTTDEITTCSYKRTGDSGGRITLSTDDKLTHTATITQSGQNTLEITCSDAYKNEVTENLEFFLKTPPSATIEIENSQDYEIDGTIVLTAGSYPVTLTASEEIQEATLRYEFQGGGSSTVALSKDDDDAKTWEGYLSIPESAGEKAASFEVEIENAEGIKGTKITQGKLFLVDTVAPEEVQNPKAERIEQRDQNYIRLSWSDNQDVKYNIYRSTIDRVSDGDYLAQTSANFYEDRGVEEESQYYYVIAAEDEAGNVGEPSRIITPSGTIKESSSDTQNDSRSQASQEKLKKAILDLETAKKNLENERSEEKLVIIREADLLEEIIALLSQLKTYEENENKDDVEEAIAKVNKILPTRIEIDSQIDYVQDTDLQSQNDALAQAARFFGQEASILETSREQSEYQTKTQQLNDETEVASKIISATVTFADRSKQEYTHVSRQVIVPVSTQPIKIVEKPFTNVERVQTRTSKNGEYLEAQIPSGESTITYKYLVKESVDLATARAAKAVALPSTPKSTDPTNSITGQVFSTEMIDFSWTYLAGILMIAGLTVYYFMTPAGPSSIDQLTNALTQVLQKQQQPQRYFSTRSTPQQYYQRRKKGFPPANSPPSRVFPSQSFFERKSLKKDLNSGPSLSEKIKTAHDYIDQKEYIPARNIYQEAIERLSDVPHHKKESVNELYYKIMLYQTVQRALESAEQKDAQKLHEQLKVLQGVAQKVPESQTTLISDAKAIYAELNRKANRLVIEQENL